MDQLGFMHHQYTRRVERKMEGLRVSIHTQLSTGRRAYARSKNEVRPYASLKGL